MGKERGFRNIVSEQGGATSHSPAHASKWHLEDPSSAVFRWSSEVPWFSKHVLRIGFFHAKNGHPTLPKLIIRHRQGELSTQTTEKSNTAVLLCCAVGCIRKTTHPLDRSSRLDYRLWYSAAAIATVPAMAGGSETVSSRNIQCIVICFGIPRHGVIEVLSSVEIDVVSHVSYRQ